MKQPSRVAVQLLFAAGAVVASGTAASAEAPPCKGWTTAAQHVSGGPVDSFAASCTGEGPIKQGWPVKWQGGN